MLNTVDTPLGVILLMSSEPKFAVYILPEESIARPLG